VRTLRRFEPILSTSAFLLLSILSLSAQQKSSVPRISGWDFGIWAAAATGEENSNSFGESKVLTVGSFVGHRITGEIGSGWRHGDLEYGFDVVPIFHTHGNQRVHGTAFDPVILRWNSAVRYGRMSPYIEVGGGGVSTSANLPPGNASTFNFMARGGGGLHVFAGKHKAFDLGLGWWHVSNANLGTRNPEFNGVQITVGYHWFR